MKCKKQFSSVLGSQSQKSERALIKLGSITRAFRHYYKTGVINKVPNKYKYQFGPYATDWRLGVQRKKARESLEKWEKYMERGENQTTNCSTPQRKESDGEWKFEDETPYVTFLSCKDPIGEKQPGIRQ